MNKSLNPHWKISCFILIFLGMHFNGHAKNQQEKTTYLKCKGQISTLMQVDSRNETKAIESKIFSVELTNDRDGSTSMYLHLDTLGGSRRLQCTSSSAHYICKISHKILTVYGKPFVKEALGTMSDTTSNSEMNIEVRLNRLNGLMEYSYNHKSSVTEPAIRNSKASERGIFECEAGSKQLF